MLRMFPKPTIAMVNGHCFGGAFTIVASCDFALAADEAVFGLSEVNWGALPAGLVSKVAATLMPYRDALYFAMTGKSFDGRRAAEVRLVNESVPAARLREEVMALADHLASWTRRPCGPPRKPSSRWWTCPTTRPTGSS